MPCCAIRIFDLADLIDVHLRLARIWLVVELGIDWDRDMMAANLELFLRIQRTGWWICVCVYVCVIGC